MFSFLPHGSERSTARWAESCVQCASQGDCYQTENRDPFPPSRQQMLSVNGAVCRNKALSGRLFTLSYDTVGSLNWFNAELPLKRYWRVPKSQEVGE